MSLALRFNWTPAQVDAMDPDYVAEVLALIRAETDQAKLDAAEAEKRRKRG